MYRWSVLIISIIYIVIIKFQAFRIFNTWVGDSSKVLLLEAVINTIKEYKLLETVQDTGNYLQNGLHDMAVSRGRQFIITA